MQLRFPNLGETKCKLFRACGYLKPKKPRKKQPPEGERNHKWFNSRFRIGEKSLVAIAAFEPARTGAGEHIHIDVATRDLFPGTVPGTKVKLAEIKSKFEAFAGSEAFVDFEGHFFLDEEHLPKLIRATKFEFGIEGITLSTQLVKFSVKGAPLYSIGWMKTEDNECIVILEARMRTTIDGDYLLTGFELLDVAFQRIVFGELIND